MRAAVVVHFLSVLAILFPVYVKEASAQASEPFYEFPHIGFPVTAPETRPVGIHYGVENGPTGGPYRYTEFFQGVTSTQGSGAWAQRNSVWKVCFNQSECTGHRILPDLYDFDWALESAYQGNRSQPTLVENNFDIRYADGTFHRPWALHVRTEEKAAVLMYSSMPGRVNFQINQNGNVVIGTPFRQPVKQLEVVGDALFTDDVDVEGELSVGGADVLTRSNHASAGPLRWGVSDGGGIDSASEICAASQLECRSAMLPTGQALSCSAILPVGMTVFALCR